LIATVLVRILGEVSDEPIKTIEIGIERTLTASRFVKDTMEEQWVKRVFAVKVNEFLDDTGEPFSDIFVECQLTSVKTSTRIDEDLKGGGSGFFGRVD
jgi:predicted secreted protein